MEISMWNKTGRVFYERYNFVFAKFIVRITEVEYQVPKILGGPYILVSYIREKRYPPDIRSKKWREIYEKIRNR